MLKQNVEVALAPIRQSLITQNSDIELLSVTRLGIVRVQLLGACCSSSIQRLGVLLNVEAVLKEQVSGVKVVINDLRG